MAREPNDLTDRPDNFPLQGSDATRSDVLSHILTLVRLRGELVYRAELEPPWTIRFPPGPSHFHYLEQGELWLDPPDAPPLHMRAGDLVLLPHGAGHSIAHDATASAQAIDPFAPPHFDAPRLLIRNGEHTPSVSLVGGLFRYEHQPLPPVVRSLPPYIHVARGDGIIPDWLGYTAHFLVAEANQPKPGSALMISRIIDLMVIRILRSWAEDAPKEIRWLGDMKAERLGRALAAMHDDPAHDWTVESLARLAGMSRSVFAERFRDAFGEPPLRYLMRWRLYIAADLLTEDDLPIGEIARRVGYDSEAGFSRAFRSFFGQAPSDRRGRPDAG